MAFKRTVGLESLFQFIVTRELGVLRLKEMFKIYLATLLNKELSFYTMYCNSELFCLIMIHQLSVRLLSRWQANSEQGMIQHSITLSHEVAVGEHTLGGVNCIN